MHRSTFFYMRVSNTCTRFLWRRTAWMQGTVLPDWDVLALRRAYYASVSQTDAMLGKVMDALNASPFAKNTVVSFWGDHGWQVCIAS